MKQFHYFNCETIIISMNQREIFPHISLFFTQILDVVPEKGVILSYQIMHKIDKNGIQKLLKSVNMEIMKFEIYNQIQLYVLSNFEEDQIWLVKYHNKTIMMFSSDY